MKINFKKLGTSLLVALGVSLAGSAHAIPELQIYIEGATYDTASETWVASGGSTLRLWAVGNVGAKGTISDVKLSAAYASGDTPTITLTSSTTGDYLGFADPSVASTPTLIQTVTDGSAPKLGDGSNLPSHGIYGAGTDWQEFSLGDFSLLDSKITDFNGTTATPSPQNSKKGQINVYEITITGTETVHFDLYNSYFSQQNDAKYVFAPFSHDGETGGNGVPDAGASLLLMSLGLVGLAAFRRGRAQ